MVFSRLLVVVCFAFTIASCDRGDPAASKVKPLNTDQHGDLLPERAMLRLGTVRFLAIALLTVVWSPDSKTLASGAYSRTISLWEVTTGKEIRRIAGQGDITWRRNSVLAWSPDGKMLASCWDEYPG